MTAPDRDPLVDALTEAILDYRGPLDVSLPIHPSSRDMLRDQAEALAAHIRAALAPRPPETADRHGERRALAFADLDRRRVDAAVDAFYREHIQRVYRSPKKRAEYLTGQRLHDGKESWRPAVAAAVAALGPVRPSPETADAGALHQHTCRDCGAEFHTSASGPSIDLLRQLNDMTEARDVLAARPAEQENQP